MEKTKVNKIYVFTDGACSGNGKKNAKAGIGIVFPNKEIDNISEEFTVAPVTNQRAELYAIYKALLIITDKCEFNNIIVYSDSSYSIKCATEYVKKWETNGWIGTNGKPVKNQDIIKPLYDLIKKHDGKISFNHVYSHTDDLGIEAHYNGLADRLACAGKKIDIKIN